MYKKHSNFLPFISAKNVKYSKNNIIEEPQIIPKLIVKPNINLKFKESEEFTYCRYLFCLKQDFFAVALCWRNTDCI